jgi:hypothetical protein
MTDRPLITMAASRAAAPSLAATRNSTVPLPCPDAGESPEIQLTDVEADHSQSAVVVTERLPVPPAASMTDAELSET